MITHKKLHLKKSAIELNYKVYALVQLKLLFLHYTFVERWNIINL